MTTGIFIKDFIKGMKYHDIGKPFFLSSEKHPLLGFIILYALGRVNEALTSLCHGKSLKENLKLCFSLNTIQKLPAYLLLASPIDQLAASTYAFQTDDPNNINGFSIQNPFSRLPVKKDRLTTFNSDFNKLGSGLAVQLWNKAGLDTLKPLKEVEEFIKSIDTNKLQGLIDLFQSNKDKINLDHLIESKDCPYQIFPERTYPPVNDTVLYEHGKLCSALALVICANLKSSSDAFLAQEITYQNNILQLDGKTIELDQKMERPFWDELRKKVKENHSSILVRICLFSFQSLFERAIRLDDLHGVREFLEEFYRKSFMKIFAEKVAKELDDSDLADVIEPLNNFAFDLVYLLPSCLGRERIKSLIFDSGKEAAKNVSCEMLEKTYNDFREIEEVAQLFKGKECLIENELLHYIPLCNLAEVEISPINLEFNEFKKAYSKRLLRAYKDLWKELPVSNTEAFELSGDNPAREICDVCGRHGIFSEFYEFYEDKATEDERNLMEKVTYSYREELDKLCMSCLGLRVLSHGTVTEEWLKDMVQIDSSSGKIHIVEGGIEIPPKMVWYGEFKREGDKIKDGSVVDLGACFVRWKHCVKEVFPSISAVADRDSNVALLWIEPEIASGLLQIYSFRDFSGLENYFSRLSKLLEDSALKRVFQTIFGTLKGKFGTRDKIDENDLSNLVDFYSSSEIKNLFKCYTGLKDRLIPINILPEDLDEPFPTIEKIFKLKESFNLSLLEEIISNLKDNLTLPLVKQPDDLANLYSNYLEVINNYRSDDEIYDEMAEIKPHLARVLTRIDWIQRFYEKVPTILTEQARIRTLRLETRYPCLIIAIPADRIVDASKVIHHILAEDLFSSAMYDENISESYRKISLKLLDEILPPVLRGAVIIFKDKQPLYNVFASAKAILEFLEKNRKGWKGTLLGYADIRGGLGIADETWVESSFYGLYNTLELCSKVDSRSITSVVNVSKREEIPLLKEAMLHIRGKKKGWDTKTVSMLKDRDIFSQVTFLKMIAKT